MYKKKYLIKIITGLIFAFISHTYFVWTYILIKNLTMEDVPHSFYNSVVLFSFILGFYLGNYIKISSIPVHFYLLPNWGISLYVKELVRPWKLLTFILGVLGLILGSYIVDLPDWDVGISIIMATFTYIFSSWSLALLLSAIYLKKNRIVSLLVFIFFYWLSVDGIYVLYNEIKGAMYFRLPNALASSVLYFLCASMWLYRGKLKEFKA